MRIRHILQHSDGGSLRLGTKSDLLTCLEDLSDAQSEAPATTSIVLDGAVISQMLKPAAIKSFDEYAQEIFIPNLSTKLQTASRLDLVWDSYTVNSLKGSARTKHGKADVVAAAAIPGNWQNFLRVDSNKTAVYKLSSSGLTRRTSSLSSLMERQSSASHYCRIWPRSPHAAMKKLTVACCSMHPMQPSMTTTR